MKILNIVKHYYPTVGGMETYVRLLCSGISKRGFDVSALAFNNVPGLKNNWEVIDGIPVRRMACHLRLFSQTVSLSFGSNMKALIAEADLVHLHSPLPTAEIFYKHISKPLIVTWCADPANTRWKKLFPLFRPSLVQILEMARRIVLIGPNLLEHSPTLQPYGHKCEVVPLAYSRNGEPNAAPSTRKLKQTGCTALFVGKFRKYKGLAFLIQAVHKLPDIQLRVVGDGEEMRKLRKLTNKLRLNSRVTFLGNISNDRLPEEYQNADLFVLPSIDASEAFGLVQVEAMSYGLPVINTDLSSGVPFVSLNGVTGITVPPCDPDALALAVKKLCADPVFYENCSRNALERAKLFNEEKMVERYAEIYKECV